MIKITKAIVILLLFSLFTFQFTALADSTSDKSINISLTLDDGNITVNGGKLSVEPPYLTSDNSTLVPLRVITTAFGAVVTWDSATQTVGLKYNNHTISVTIDSKQAIVDGKTIDMNTAPQLHNATTMVPLRFITENFGAKINFNKDTKQITIVGSGTSTDKTSTGLNTDAGKTKIGDSYNNWSMKYPTGLVKTYQSFKGTLTDFSDANDEYILHITIADSDVQNLSAEGLLNKVADYVKDTILNKTTVTDKGTTYAKVVSKDKNGLYNETRAFFSNGKIYYLDLYVKKEANYTNPIKYAGYKELLDSFTPSFNASDITLKDLSTAKNGYRKYASDDYGFSLNIPADWFKAEEKGSNFHFYSDNTLKQDIYVSVSSIADGDSLDAWVAREDKDFTDTFVAAYGTLGTAQSIKVNNVDAKENIYSQNAHGKWDTDDSIYIVNGKLKYNIDFIYPKDAPPADIKTKRDAFINSFVFTNKINPEIGFIADSKANKTTKSKIINKELKLSLELPEYWKENTKAEGINGGIDYEFSGGGIGILSNDKSKDQMSKVMEDGLRSNSKISIVSISDTTIAGVSARKIIYTNNDVKSPGSALMYIFGDNNKSYILLYFIGTAYATPAAQQRIDDVVASIQFTP